MIYNTAKPSLVRRILLILAPLLILALAAFGLFIMDALKPKPEKKEKIPTAAPVVTSTAFSQITELRVQSQGEVRPRNEINVSTQVGGKVIYVSPNFLGGGQFKKGEVLIRLESEDYNLRVTQAQSNVAQAQTALTRELSEADIAKRDWEDIGEGEASPLSLRQPQVAERRAQLASAMAALDEAKLNLGRTTLYAPFDGRVREKNISAGEFIAAGQKLGRVYGIGIVDIKLPLTDNDMSKLGLGIGFKASQAKPGAKVTFSAIVAGEAREWSGVLTRTDSSYDSETRVIYGYANVKNPYSTGSDNGTPLAVGLFVNAEIGGREIIQSTIVPRTALRGRDIVYVANADKTLSMRTVKVASSSRHQVVITSGLEAGEQVIVSPVRGAAEGMKIEIAKPKPKPKPDAGNANNVVKSGE
ncbi:MAG: efflux RND transporter periplasmic adaptor subunit [Robiginitomaculum sp.]